MHRWVLGIGFLSALEVLSSFYQGSGVPLGIPASSPAFLNLKSLPPSLFLTKKEKKSLIEKTDRDQKENTTETQQEKLKTHCLKDLRVLYPKGSLDMPWDGTNSSDLGAGPNITILDVKNPLVMMTQKISF